MPFSNNEVKQESASTTLFSNMPPWVSDEASKAEDCLSADNLSGALDLVIKNPSLLAQKVMATQSGKMVEGTLGCLLGARLAVVGEREKLLKLVDIIASFPMKEASSILRMDASLEHLLAARLAVTGKREKLLELVEIFASFPIEEASSILRMESSVQIPVLHKWVKGTLIGILGMTGEIEGTLIDMLGMPEEIKRRQDAADKNDVNPAEELILLILKKDILSVKKIDEQVAKVLPANWQAISSTRMLPLITALEQFAEGLATVSEEQARLAWEAVVENRLDSLKNNPCIDLIHQYRKQVTAENSGNEVVESGLVSDPRYLIDAVNQFWGTHKQGWADRHLGGWNSFKSNLFADVGIRLWQSTLLPRHLKILEQTNAVISSHQNRRLFAGFFCVSDKKGNVPDRNECGAKSLLGVGGAFAIRYQKMEDDLTAGAKGLADRIEKNEEDLSNRLTSPRM